MRSKADHRESPAYTVSEAARYLGIPVSTLRSWVIGRKYPTSFGVRLFRPLISIAARKPDLLSFMNLVEAHVLDAIRQDYGVPIMKVRTALDYVSKRIAGRNPLATQEFETDGLNLFVHRYGQLINVSQDGQLAMRQLLEAYLHRIERDASGIPSKLYPFTRKRSTEEPKVVVIDPSISFGRPVLVGTGVPTAVIADRYKAGESIDALADDYGRGRLEIEDAIRSELQVEAA